MVVRLPLANPSASTSFSTKRDLLAFLHIDAQLGRADAGRQLGENLGGGFLERHEDLEHARRAVDSVVEAVPAILEKDVATHLTGERRAALLELVL